MDPDPGREVDECAGCGGVWLDDLQRARSSAHAMRFVLPTCRIPVNRDRGAY